MSALPVSDTYSLRNDTRRAACHRAVRSLHARAWETYRLHPQQAATLTANARALIGRESSPNTDRELYAENLALQAVTEILAKERSIEPIDRGENLAQDAVAEALAILPPDSAPLLRAQVEYAQAEALTSQFDYDRAEIVLRSLLDLLPNESDTIGVPMTPEVKLLVHAVSDIGNIQHRRGAFPEALETQLRAYALAIRNGGDEGYLYGKATALNRLGNVYDRLGDYTAAIDAHQRCLTLRRTLEDRYGEASTLNNLANVYLQFEQPEPALEYYHLGLALCREIGHRQQEAGLLGNMGIAFQMRGDLDQAIAYYEESLGMKRQMHLPETEASTLSNLGEALQKKGRFVDARHSLEQALQIYRQLGNKYGITISLTLLGNLEAQLRDPVIGTPLRDEGDFVPLLNEALAEAEQTGSQDLVVSVHAAFAEAYKVRREFERALQHYELYHAGKEAMFKAQTVERTRTLKLKHEMEQSRKEAEIQRLRSVELVAALREAEAQRSLAERLANEDALTGLTTRRRGAQIFVAAFETAIKTGTPLSVILADADFFKEINDQFSHAAGDAVLRHLGAICRQHCRPTDTAIRFGGEEFLFVLPDTPQEEAVLWAERLREAVERYDWRAIHPDLAVTLSLGVCSRFPTADPTRAETMTHMADIRLYEAKNAGRNRVCY